MPWAAAGAVVGGLVAANASSGAAKTQANSARDANQAQLSMYNQTRDDQAPYRQAGYTALNQIGGGTDPGGEFNRNFTMGDFQADPGYAFRQQQGQQAVQNSAAASSGALSGSTLKGLLRFGQDNASQEYMAAYDRFNNNNTLRFNRLATLSGLGQTSVGATGTLGAGYANSIGNNITGAGNAMAAGQVGVANAFSGALNTAGGFLGTSKYSFGNNSAAGSPYQGATYNDSPLSGSSFDTAYG